MRLLLDTHLLLWAAGSPERLPPVARELLDDAQNVPVFSSASLWEVAIKRGLGRSDFRVDPEFCAAVCWNMAMTSCRSPASMP
jgi:PIN domain nuclease of toxin-antitoxin system